MLEGCLLVCVGVCMGVCITNATDTMHCCWCSLLAPLSFHTLLLFFPFTYTHSLSNTIIFNKHPLTHPTPTLISPTTTLHSPPHTLSLTPHLHYNTTITYLVYLSHCLVIHLITAVEHITLNTQCTCQVLCCLCLTSTCGCGCV